jgi:hypothetical protein
VLNDFFDIAVVSIDLVVEVFVVVVEVLVVPINLKNRI